jgi:ABC-2 type transport system permease protein
MHKLTSAVYKETLFLLRDIPGLAILFLMPLLLVLVVTLAQEHAVNRSGKTPLTVIDEAGTPLSHRIVDDIDSSGMFIIEIQNSKFKIQDSITEYRTPNAENRMPKTKHRTSPLTLYLAPNDSIITLIFDPTLAAAEKRSLQSTLTFIIKGAQAKQVMENTLDRMFVTSDTTLKMMVRSSLLNGMAAMPEIREQYDLPENSEIRPSVVQNNVPGFILFAMFFIVIPLSASMIAEKNEGAFTRLMTLPVARGIFLFSKVIVYLAVCLLQFILMIIMGTWLFPSIFGLDALYIGNHYLAIAVVTVAASLAAIGFGILTGTFARTMGQAALFGSVMVVILGLISGTFLPIRLMPAAIQYISYLSPVRWGIDSYLVIFIRGGGIREVILWLLSLVVFFGLAMTISIHIFAKKK